MSDAFKNPEWGKPIAYHLLSVNIDDEKPKLSNYFVGQNGQVLLWNSTPLASESYEDSIRLAEYATRVNTGQPYLNSDKFAFLTQEEQYAELLG